MTLMNKYTKLAAAVVVAGIISSPAMAARSKGGMGPRHLADGFSVNGAVSLLGAEFKSRYTDNNRTTQDLNLGKFAPMADIGAQYNFHMGDKTAIAVGLDVMPVGAKLKDDVTNAGVTTRHTLKIKHMVGLYVKPAMGLTKDTSAFMKVSYKRLRVSASGTATTAVDKKNPSGLGLGLGTETQLSRDWSMAVEAGVNRTSKIKLSGLGTQNTATATARPTMAYGKVSLGYKV
jgi:opacity protein-like surface antigen